MALRCVWSPPPPPPFPSWVILQRAAQVPPGMEPADPSLVLREPPLVSNLAVPFQWHPRRYSDGLDSDPYIIAGNDAGFLIHVSWSPFIGFNLNHYPPGVLEVVSNFVQAAGNGAATGAAELIPPHAISNIKSVGLVPIPGTGRREYVVAEFRISVPEDGGDGEDGDDGPSLFTFRSGTDAWVQREVSCPDGWDWTLPVHDVIAHGEKLWWVNLEHGLLGGDPLGGDENAGETVLRHVAMPYELDLANEENTQNLEHIRMVSVSNRKIRCVGMKRLRDHPPEAVEVSIWTLVQRPALSWKPRCITTLGQVWSHESYRDQAELTREVPVLALLHPANPDVAYFFLGHYLFGVDVDSSEVVDFLPVQHGLREVALPFSWRHVLAWMLPDSLEGVLDHEYMDNEHYPADSDPEDEIGIPAEEMDVDLSEE
ncbi:hypothetical protein HU200_050168 [Digitaria exilis]|uniref:DUF1618 domain-containing protein n=1 Tax=Digitaria exilis TaxID=1010633 RepID=A0A835ATR5_9POAL|nr:hypothetical protein HU200_050168 [Digitaria exilis]